jgi:hypothetical protein
VVPKIIGLQTDIGKQIFINGAGGQMSQQRQIALRGKNLLEIMRIRLKHDLSRA